MALSLRTTSDDKPLYSYKTINRKVFKPFLRVVCMIKATYNKGLKIKFYPTKTDFIFKGHFCLNKLNKFRSVKL